jgi:Methyltransferase domain
MDDVTATARLSLRDRERESIREFVGMAGSRGHFNGAVLDIGAGQQPYRDIVEAFGGEYVPFDSPVFPGSCADTDTTGLAQSRRFDTALCTQVLQYVEDVPHFLDTIHRGRLLRGGHLVLSYVTNWPEIEDDDIHRHTRSGMNRLLDDAGFEVMWGLPRHDVKLRGGDRLILGYGVVAQARL